MFTQMCADILDLLFRKGTITKDEQIILLKKWMKMGEEWNKELQEIREGLPKI